MRSGRIHLVAHYEDNTEPDLVIEVGRYYILIEAKYLSDFGRVPAAPERNQLRRELHNGRNAARTRGAEFILLTITSESYCDRVRYRDIQPEDEACWRWTNWQRFTRFLEGRGSLDRLGELLLQLLLARGLRGFRGFDIDMPVPAPPATLLFDPATAAHSGCFLGFNRALGERFIPPPPEALFHQIADAS